MDIPALFFPFSSMEENSPRGVILLEKRCKYNVSRYN